jgi:hypothetical protein
MPWMRQQGVHGWEVSVYALKKHSLKTNPVVDEARNVKADLAD